MEYVKKGVLVVDRWIFVRVIGFGALTYFLLRFTVDEHFNLYDVLPVAILVGIIINELLIRKRKNRSSP